jgi:aryl-alcohol dehydrogenase-like predicted oxidoreductase
MTAATPAGTSTFGAEFGGTLADGHFRRLDGLTVSSIGLGTYLGADDDATDRAYAEAIAAAARLGTNVFDAAINYRSQRSERVLGRTLAALAKDGRLARERAVVCTKGGFIPFEGKAPEDARRFVEETYVRTGLLRADQIVGGAHAMTPEFLTDQIARSRTNLSLETIDLYYVHNPETQLAVVSRNRFATVIRAAFEALEAAVVAGHIARYGVATWNGFRRAPDARDHLSLEALVRAAEAVGGKHHHLKAIQLPYNLGMYEAFATPTQKVGDEVVTVLEAAARLGVAVVASASLLQGRLVAPLPPALADAFPGCETAAARALQFVRSSRGITTALAGMSRAAHVEENLAVARVPPAPAGVDSLFTRG